MTGPKAESRGKRARAGQQTDAVGPAVSGAEPRRPAGNLVSLDRGISLLAVVSESSDGMRLTDAAAAVGLSASTAHRILGALVEHGLLRMEQTTRRYRPGPGLFRLGAAAARHYGLADVARPSLQRLAALTEDTVSLTVIEGLEALCLDRIYGTYPIKTMTLEVGQRRPLGVGAGSLALLSALPPQERRVLIEADAQRRMLAHPNFTSENLTRWADDAARKGYAYSPERVLGGMSGVGVAIPGPGSRPLAAISISGITSRFRGDRLKELVEHLQRECSVLVKEFGHLG